MTTTTNNEQKKLNFSSEREQSQACLNSAEHEKNQGRKVLNVPNLRFPEFQGEWEKCTLEDVINFSTTRVNSSELNKDNYVSTENMLQDYQGIVKAKSVPEDVNVVSFSCGDVLISNIRPYLKKVWKATFNGGCSSDVFVLKANDNIESDYLHYVIANDKFINFVMSGTKGVKMPRGDKKQMETYSLSLPQIQEQHKIARLLSLLDERIATQNKIIDKLQSLIKGINQSIFMNNNVINYKLGEVCGIRSGYSGNQLLSKKGLKVSRIETISGHKVNLERVGYVAPFESSENYRLRVGDILFSNINSVEYIGNTAFIDKDYDLYHGMNLLRLTPNNMVVIPFYLYLLLNTNRMLNRFKTICNKAVSQASINQTELGKTVVQIPDINAQEQICKFYQTLYDKLESEKYANSLFQKQKQYLLRQMFI